MHASAQKTTLTNTPNMGISASMDTCLTIDTSLSIDKLLSTDTRQSEHRGRSFCWFVLNSICKQRLFRKKMCHFEIKRTVVRAINQTCMGHHPYLSN